MSRYFGLVFLMLFTLSTTTVLAKTTDKEEAVVPAVAAAEQWLAGIDAGNYAQSWQDAAALFKEAIPPEGWSQALQGVRSPLGKMMSREVVSAVYLTSVPGGPDGEYVFIQFKTSFENKESAIEAITPMKDKDGQWRVSGYYIK